MYTLDFTCFMGIGYKKGIAVVVLYDVIVLTVNSAKTIQEQY